MNENQYTELSRYMNSIRERAAEIAMIARSTDKQEAYAVGEVLDTIIHLCREILEGDRSPERTIMLASATVRGLHRDPLPHTSKQADFMDAFAKDLAGIMETNA